jgi:D-alanyl-D-alanine carboxypeptidase/D-alanyl-D-alanine-endopeptidase (penicillin-binding protein 4)
MKADMTLFLKISFLLLVNFSTNAFNYKLDSHKDETWSWSFQKIEGKDHSINRNENNLFVPASILKIVSMSYALDILGPQYIFKTKIFHDGKIKNGNLEGNIYILGGSDPYLQHPQLFNMAKSIKNFGINEIKGQIIYDISAYPEHEKVSDLGFGDQTYNPSFGPLNSIFNRHSLWKKGRNEYVSIIPELEIELTPSKNLLPTQKFSWKKQKKKESWDFNRKNKFKKREDIPIRNAALWTTKILRYHLNSLGVKATQIQRGIVPRNAKSIFTNRSLPLSHLVSLTMEYSNNLLAETIAMKACQENNVSPLNQVTCAKSINEYFNKRSNSKAILVNASGLSTKNLVSSKGISEFIKKTSKKSWSGQTLESFLSISGQTGWMRKRLNTPKYNMHVFAKTGSLDFISNISGLIRTRTNAWYSFNINHSNMKKRKLIDSKDSSSLKKLKNEAKSWRKRSQNKTNYLIQSFIDQY